MATKIIIDAGHGGYDNGASYQGRREKDDTLRLALALGDVLRGQGYDVEYTRTSDVYQSPVEKARIGNASGADYFISLHRNAAATPGSFNGVQTLVYDKTGIKNEMAENINSQLEEVGYNNINVEARPNLAVLRRTNMPSLLVEVGFIDNDIDNDILDNNFEQTVQAIADGIDQTLSNVAAAFAAADDDDDDGDDDDDFEDRVDGIKRDRGYEKDYQILVGIFRNFGSASYQKNRLENRGFDAEIFVEDELYQVRVGEFDTVEEALKTQKRLQDLGYATMIVRQ